MQKIIIFGIGQVWEKNKSFLEKNDEIIAFLDNHSKFEFINGIRVVAPTDVHKFQYDYIVIMSRKYENDMRLQLQKLKVDMERVYSWDEYAKCVLKDTCLCYNLKKDEKAEVMIFSSPLDYSGAPMTVLYSAQILMKKGHSVRICTNRCDEKLLCEILESNIELVLAPAFPEYFCLKVVEMTQRTDVVIANTILMLPAVRNIQRKKPVLWWIHEAVDAYTWLKEENVNISCEALNIKAVSGIALKNFNSFFNMEIQSIMPYGIPNENYGEKEHSNIVFAIVGSVSERKAQDVFVEAIGLLTEKEREKCEFWIIGYKSVSSYTVKLDEQIKYIKQIKCLGTLTRKEIKEAYKMIDVVVCPSREDPLPIVMTEAMMSGKVCIASEKTGTAEYIDDGVNGFICKNEDASDLCNKMRHLIKNRNEIKSIGNKGRKLYEDNWTLEYFGERLERVLDETIEKFDENDKR